MNLVLIDKYSSETSPVHRLNPTVALFSFLGFVVAVVLAPTGSFAPLLAAFLSLSIVVLVSRVPARFILGRSLVVIPFAMAIGAFNLLGKAGEIFLQGRFSSSPAFVPIGASPFLSMMLKSFLCVVAMTLLVSTMGSARLLSTFRRIGVPSGITVVAGFLCRYVTLVAEELLRMKRARDARRAGRFSRVSELRSAGRLVGVLFIRSYERAERIHAAMCSRGFDCAGVGVFTHGGLTVQFRAGVSRQDFLLPALLLGPLVLTLIAMNVMK